MRRQRHEQNLDVLHTMLSFIRLQPQTYDGFFGLNKMTTQEFVVGRAIERQIRESLARPLEQFDNRQASHFSPGT